MGRLQCILFRLVVFVSAVKAGGPYYYTGAQWAVQAQCPESYPLSCNSISKGNYCCPSDQYCTWVDARVACCPNDCTCSGWSPEEQSSQQQWQPSTTEWQPSTTEWQPSTTEWHSSYQPEPTCDVCEEHTTTVYQPQQQSTTEYQPQEQSTTEYQPQEQSTTQYDQGFCSTIYAVGPGLPTSREGECGLILIESPSAAARTFEAGWGLAIFLWILGLQTLGVMLLLWR